MSDNVNHPSHYNTNNPYVNLSKEFSATYYANGNTRIIIECIDVIRDMPTWKGNAIKYLWRAGLKKSASLSSADKEIEDLQKAIWYIEDRIKQLQYEQLSSGCG